MNRHVGVSVKGLDVRLRASKPHSDHGLWKVLQDENGRFLNWDETRIEVDKAMRKGLEVFTGCDNVDEKGHCKGHSEE